MVPRFAILVISVATACSDPQVLSICGRGDRVELAQALEGGSLEVRFLDAEGEVVGDPIVASADQTTPISDSIPTAATQVRIDGFAAGSSTPIALGQAMLTDDEACVCLALNQYYAAACDRLSCAVVGETCRFFSSGEPVGSQTITVGENSAARVQNATLDTSIRADDPESSDPDGALLGMDTTPEKRVLVGFELPIPQTAEIDRAALWLTLCPEPSCTSSSGQLVAYAVTEEWDAQASWNRRLGSAVWQTPGVGVGSRAVGESGRRGGFDQPGAAYELQLDPSTVASWVAQPNANFGLVLILTGTTSGLDVLSSEAADATGRPYLEVEYRLP